MILLYLSNKLNIPCYAGARSGRNAGIQPEGGDTLLKLGEGRCSTSQVLPSTSGEL